MKIIYLVCREALSPAVESQLVKPAALMSEKHDVVMVALTSIGYMLRPSFRRRLTNLKNRNAKNGIRTVMVPGSPSRWKPGKIDRMVLNSVLWKEVHARNKVVAHARNSESALQALDCFERFRGNVKVVYDCRGDEASEAVGSLGYDTNMPDTWSHKAKAIYSHALKREGRAASESDAVIAVSETMKHMLMKRHHLPKEKITVMPCAVDMNLFSDVDRDESRQQMGLTDNFVVAYLGSAQWYQRLDEALNIYQAIKNIKNNAIFMAITSQPQRMRREIAIAGVAADSYKIFNVKSDEVPSILCAADMGLLLRHRDRVNVVASPIKCAEYLASGVPCLLTEGIGDYSKMLPDNRVGWTIDLNATSGGKGERMRMILDTYDNDIEEIRQRCIHFVNSKLCWSALLPELASVYKFR